MDFLCVSDLHGELQAKQFLLDFVKATKPDAILLAGDVTSGSVAFAEELFEELEKTKIPFFAVHGNNDPQAVQDFFEKSGHMIAERCIDFRGFRLCGLGGSPHTPFDTAVEYTEGEIAAFLEKIGPRIADGKDCILLSHTPPKDTESDKTSRGNHVGSTALREFVLEKKPAVLVCGHVHERHLVEKLRETVIAKTGTLMQKKALLLQMPERKVTLL